MRLDRSAVLVALLCALQPADLVGQLCAAEIEAVSDSVTIVPGSQYAKSGFVRLFAGSGHRDLWTIPLRVEVADLSTLAGGLTPLRLGGGMTTQTLHVRGGDGRRYVCRSVDKYPGQGLDEELRGTFYEAVLQDQISSFHPSGALVVPMLLDAVDVLHVEPKLYVLPDDPRLGEFRELMANQLVTFEERPDDGPEGRAGFAGSSRILDTQDFMAELENDPRNRLDALGYLTARLVDLLVGDRDRSVNNWWWARFDAGGEYVWKPIPRDRDQAFIQLDGLAKGIIRIYEPRMVRFGTAVPSVWGLSRSAWDMDRPFLSVIEKSVWDSVVTSVQRRLPDAVIEDAVGQMPPEHVAAYAAPMARQLKLRRDRLRETADRFYRIVSEYADIHTTDAAEDVVVEWVADGRATVSVHTGRSGEMPVIGTGDGGEQAPAYLRRTFDQSETREIRLYLHGGDDRLVIRGSGHRSMTLRVVGGGGTDSLTDSSVGGGGRRTYFYDADGGTGLVRGRGTTWVRREAPRPQSWGERAALSPDWGSKWVPSPAFPYSSDLGVLIYAGASRTGHTFGKYPYGSVLRFGAGYAPLETKFVANLSYESRKLFGDMHGSFVLDYSGIETLRFYGLGNDTEAAADPGFNKLHRVRFLARPLLFVSLGSVGELGVGARFEFSDTDTLPDQPNLVSTTRPYGTGLFLQGAAEATLKLDTRDRPMAATRGILVRGSFRTHPALLDVDRPFSKVYGEASTYLSPSTSGGPTLALRVGGEKIWGTFPYYEAAFLGGPRRLRGFSRERFAGDAALFGSGEIRLALGQAGFVIPWHLGVFGFGDVGRVYVSGESPGDWHTSWGGGITGAPIDRRFTGSFTVARSPEGTTFYVGSGFGF